MHHAYTPGAPDLALCGYAPGLSTPSTGTGTCPNCLAVQQGTRPAARYMTKEN